MYKKFFATILSILSLFCFPYLFPHSADTPSTNFTSPIFSVSQQRFPTFAIQTVRADSSSLSTPTYACILQETYFYSVPDERYGIFLLPKTYYVKVVEWGETYCKIEYLYDEAKAKKIIGYAKTASLTFVDYVPNRPYLYYTFDVQYVISNDVPTGDNFLNQITVHCTYYGDYPMGSKTYCYVLQGETFGYIPKPINLTFDENPEYADRLAQAKEEQPTPSDSNAMPTSSPTQIAILVAVCLLVPLLASLILKPPKRPPYETDE